MRKHFITSILLTGILALMLFSCGTNDTPLNVPPVPIANYFPSSSGSYWIYQSGPTDSTGSFIADSLKTDSVYVGASAEILGNSCTTFVTQTPNLPDHSDYFRGDSTHLYALSDYLYGTSNIIPFDLPLPSSRWIKLADMNSLKTDQLFDTVIHDFTVVISEQNLVIPTLEYKITNSRAASPLNVLVGGSAVPGYQFTVSHTLNASGNTVLGDITIRTDVYYYYAGNIGFVSMTANQPIITATDQVQTLLSSVFPKKGYSRSLLRYYIKPV